MEYLMNLCLIQQERLIWEPACCCTALLQIKALSYISFILVWLSLSLKESGTSGNLSVPTVCKQAVLGAGWRAGGDP